MAWGFILLLIFIGAPIAKGIGRRLESNPPPQDPGRDLEMRQALLLAEQRLSDSETRLAALEERVDFYERLLANPTSSSKPEPPSHPS
jgi:hypothetical protein